MNTTIVMLLFLAGAVVHETIGDSTDGTTTTCTRRTKTQWQKASNCEREERIKNIEVGQATKIDANVAATKEELETLKGTLTALISEQTKLIQDTLTTKEEITVLKAELETQITNAKGELETQITDAEGKLETQITNAKAELETQITNAKGELETQITDAKGELGQEMTDAVEINKIELETQINSTKGELGTLKTKTKKSAICGFHNGSMTSPETIEYADDKIITEVNEVNSSLGTNGYYTAGVNGVYEIKVSGYAVVDRDGRAELGLKGALGTFDLTRSYYTNTNETYNQRVQETVAATKIVTLNAGEQIYLYYGEEGNAYMERIRFCVTLYKGL